MENSKIHDNFFKKTFKDKKNIRDFLKLSLPEEIKGEIDYSFIKIDNTGYVSENIKGYFSDIVIKTRLKSKTGKDRPLNADIYILFEHKSYKDKRIFVQLLKYMYLMWQKDADNNKPLRVILLLASLMLMKSAKDNNFEIIEKIFDFWREKGFIEGNKDEKLIFFLTYIVSTRDIPERELINLIEEKKLLGGDSMPTLAQRWIEEGEMKGKTEGKIEGKLETAKKMHKKGFSLEEIIDITELSEEELKKAGIS